MEQAFMLAGFFAAHAIWSVCEGEDLIPLLGSLTPDGKRHLQRFTADELTEAVAQGKSAFQTSSESPAVFIFDTRITLPDGKTDALILDIRANGSAPLSARMAIPYRNASEPAGFAVFRPKFLALSEPQLPLEPVVQAFFNGVGQHEQGSKIWNEKIDQSR